MFIYILFLYSYDIIHSVSRTIKINDRKLGQRNSLRIVF